MCTDYIASKLRESGDTLIEILITVVVLAIGIVGLLPGMASSLRLGDHFAQQSKADQVLTQVIETLQNASYVCGDATSYNLIATGLATTTGQLVTVDKLEYWRDATPLGPTHVYGFGVAVCPLPPKDGPIFKTQRLTVTVASKDGRGKQTVEVVKRP
jgi:type II secretory pathway pseudopilin PulG